MGKRDISGDGEVRRPDPSEKPHDYGEGRHAGELGNDDNDRDDQASGED